MKKKKNKNRFMNLVGWVISYILVCAAFFGSLWLLGKAITAFWNLF